MTSTLNHSGISEQTSGSIVMPSIQASGELVHETNVSDVSQQGFLRLARVTRTL